MAPRTLPSSLPRAVLVASALAASAAVAAAAGKTRAELMRGVSYGPVPFKTQEGMSTLPEDDWFCDEAVPMWGRAGRADLRTIRSMGANMIRLYGNNPSNDHTNFLDEASSEGLSVAAGMSDYPYYQQVRGSCKDATNFNCFSQVKPQYEQNLRNGFLTMRNEYHPALKYMNILNEPDLKMPHTADIGGEEDTKQMARTIISAFDGMLQAEKELGVVGPLINFTATFSYAVCRNCGEFAGKPALGQIWRLHDAMHHPEEYGYTPQNNITAAYEARFVHSFNTQNPATDLQHQFLDDYSATFPSTPVYIGEYHRVPGNQTEDLDTILGLAEQNPLFLGISFFEYQVSYWKTGSEMDFGMFGLGDFVLAEMPYFSETYSIYCLAPMDSPASGMSMPDAVAKVFGGSPIDTTHLCQANPLAVPPTQEGFETVAAQKADSQMVRFIENTIHHMGGTVSSDGLSSLATLATDFATSGSSESNGDFAQLAGFLGGKPTWVSFDDKAQCVSNRNVGPTVIGAAIAWTCSRAKTFSCGDVPSYCSKNTYRIADFVFSRFYKELGASADPLTDCNFGGAAMFASSKLYDTWTGSAQCVSGETTFTTTNRASTSTFTASSLTVTTTTATTTTFTGSSTSFMGHADIEVATMRFNLRIGLPGLLNGTEEELVVESTAEALVSFLGASREALQVRILRSSTSGRQLSSVESLILEIEVWNATEGQSTLLLAGGGGEALAALVRAGAVARGLNVEAWQFEGQPSDGGATTTASAAMTEQPKPQETVHGMPSGVVVVVVVALFLGLGLAVLGCYVIRRRWQTSITVSTRDDDKTAVASPGTPVMTTAGHDGADASNAPPLLHADAIGPSFSLEKVSPEEYKSLQAMLTDTFRDIQTRDRGGAAVPRALRLVKASRVENWALWERYCAARHGFRTKHARGCTSVATFGGKLATESGLLETTKSDLQDKVNEAFLWHGTSPGGAQGISQSGFKLDLAGSNAGTMYGKGVYLAECSSKSDEYASDDKTGIYKDLFCLLLCRVTLGEVLHLTNGGDAVHPMIKAGIESQAYDSVLGDRAAAVGTYREFVTYNEDQVYPAYILIYERLE